MSCLINARIGGVVVSQTQALMDAYGVSKATATARDLGYVLIDGHEVQPCRNIYGILWEDGVGSMYVYSATNVRLCRIVSRL